MEIRTFQEAVALFRNLVIAVVVITAILFVYMKADEISDMIFGLVDRMGSAEIAGVKITFDEKGFDLNQDIAQLSHDERKKVLKNLKHLTPDEFGRLLHIAGYNSKVVGVIVGSKDIPDSMKDVINCDYDHATAQMRLFAAADQGLFEKKLVELRRSPELIETVRRATKDHKPETGKSPGIGNPSNCYTMTLTPDGSNLKSIIVLELKKAFGPNMRAE
jgi:hypothetical protein